MGIDQTNCSNNKKALGVKFRTVHRMTYQLPNTHLFQIKLWCQMVRDSEFGSLNLFNTSGNQMVVYRA